MRVLVLMLAVAAVVPVGATTCVTFTPRGITFFFGSTGAGFASWNGAGMFMVERVVSGSLRVNELLPYEPGICDHLDKRDVYFISRVCGADGCRVHYAEESEGPQLMRYLRRAHAETHETILAKTIRWCEGRMSLAAFHDWIQTISVKPRSPEEDVFVLRLLDILENLAFNAAQMPQGATIEAELREVAKLARDFPPGTPEEFDVNDMGPWRNEYEGPLIEALERARDATAATIPRRQ
jgi:hypothetical protein